MFKQVTTDNNLNWGGVRIDHPRSSNRRRLGGQKDHWEGWTPTPRQIGPWLRQQWTDFYQQDCREAATAGIKFTYLEAENEHFRPVGGTRCTDSREIWCDRGSRGSAWSCEISRQSVRGDGNAAQI